MSLGIIFRDGKPKFSQASKRMHVSNLTSDQHDHTPLTMLNGAWISMACHTVDLDWRLDFYKLEAYEYLSSFEL